MIDVSMLGEVEERTAGPCPLCFLCLMDHVLQKPWHIAPLCTCGQSCALLRFSHAFRANEWCFVRVNLMVIKTPDKSAMNRGYYMMEPALLQPAEAMSIVSLHITPLLVVWRLVGDWAVIRRAERDPTGHSTEEHSMKSWTTFSIRARGNVSVERLSLFLSWEKFKRTDIFLKRKPIPSKRNPAMTLASQTQCL